MQRIAHRGAKREFPENTIPAFQRAFERGADAVELDVHSTGDGIVIVHHDPEVRIDGMTTAAIAGARWDDLRSVDLGGGASIPTLEQVIAITPPHATIYVEIKGAGIERLVAQVLASARVSCAVHSFDHAAIVTMRALAPELPRGVLFDGSTPDLEALVGRTGARDVWPHWKLIDRELVTRTHALGARVIAWTVNDRRSAASLAALRVDGLCGDDVREFEELIA